MYDSLPKTCQTLRKLYEFDEAYRREHGFGLEIAGLALDRFGWRFEICNLPLNAGVFAFTGRGDIYSIVKVKEHFGEDSPVIETDHERTWDPGLVAAPNLREFLSVGSYSGFENRFAPEICDRDTGWFFCAGLDGNQRAILSDLRSQLSLEPVDPAIVCCGERNEKVDSGVMALLEIRDEMKGLKDPFEEFDV